MALPVQRMGAIRMCVEVTFHVSLSLTLSVLLMQLRPQRCVSILDSSPPHNPKCRHCLKDSGKVAAAISMVFAAFWLQGRTAFGVSRC